MRFDSDCYLEDFRVFGRYPKIHDALFSVVATELWRNNNVLDLCCSTGLMGERLRGIISGGVYGIEADLSAVNKARESGISFEILNIKVEPATLGEVVGFIDMCSIGAVVARRCFPELFSHDFNFGREFARRMASSGVRQLFIQGRNESCRSKNPLGSLKSEIELVSDSYALRYSIGQVAYLTSK